MGNAPFGSGCGGRQLLKRSAERARATAVHVRYQKIAELSKNTVLPYFFLFFTCRKEKLQIEVDMRFPSP